MAELSPEEQNEYDRLSAIYKSAGGTDNPLEETTVRIYRGEENKQPEKCVRPNQIKRLRELFRKKTGEIKPE